jgi:hypothetical protein
MFTEAEQDQVHDDSLAVRGRLAGIFGKRIVFNIIGWIPNISKTSFASS